MTTIIEPRRSMGGRGLREVVERRELLWHLTRREIKVRYAESTLGAIWALLQPVTLTLVFGFFARFVVRVETGEVPYPVFVFAGLVPWTFFTLSVTTGANSLLNNVAMVSKIYFPRLILPLSSVGAALVDAMIGSVVIVIMAAAFGLPPTPQLLLLPVFLAMVTVFAASIGAAFAGLVVRFRDVRHAVPLLLQTMLFLSPVIYPASLVPERWRWLYDLNPLSTALTGYRWAVTGVGDAPSLVATALALVVLALAMVGSLTAFGATERSYADLV